MFDDNKRKFPRASYACLLTIWYQDGEHEVILTQTVNIGAGGLAVHLNQRVDPDCALEISIEFPNQTTPFKCKGKAVRCIEHSDGADQKFYAVGVEFDPMDEVKQAYLQGVVSDLIVALEKSKKN